jgi:hypothetical protein
MSAELRSNVVPWPIAPRPFYEEAFGGWLGRVDGAVSTERCDAVANERKRAAALAWNCRMDSFPSDFSVSPSTIRNARTP